MERNYRKSAPKAFAGLTLVFVIVIAAGCTRQPPNPTAFFPASGDVVGWTRNGQIRTFDAPDLWKYIDGEAERYLKAGVQRASTADYKFHNKVDAVADIYTMRNADSARQIFDSEPTADAETIALGDGARLYAQSIVFRKGRYLVRIVAYAYAAELQTAITELGRSIAQRLTQ